jgi:hypothetical protein
MNRSPVLQDDINQPRKERKVFFSEEKKQKTFIFRPWPSRVGPLQEQKFFGSFFQKRTCFTSFLLRGDPQ